MLDVIEQDLKAKLPDELVDALLRRYEEIKLRFYIGQHEPSELNGGKFVEIAIRILQHEVKGHYTPLDDGIRNVIGKLREFEQERRGSVDESFRIHIPRVLIAIYNIRNKRGVGHVGGEVNPNHADASLIVASADWAMAEFLRLFRQCSIEDAQRLVDSLVERPVLLVHDISDKKRVLLPRLSFKDQVLLLLAANLPHNVRDVKLIEWVEPANPGDFKRRVLSELHKKRFIEYGVDGDCELLPTGIRYVEKQYERWLADLN